MSAGTGRVRAEDDALTGLENADLHRAWTPAQRLAAHALAVLTLALSCAYLVWRSLFTLDLGSWWVAIPLLALEVHLVFRLALTVMELWNIDAAPAMRPVASTSARVVVFIATYDEGPEVLLPTLAAAVALEPAHETWVLDDGKRDEVREMAESLGARYVARPTNEHAKAGNINHALGICDADFIAVLDADHVPEENFLRHTLGYFADPNVALVQTPQEFYNGDSFLHMGRKGRHEEQFFHRVIMPGKNRSNAAFWTGTNAVLRADALRWIGGVSTVTITEDMHTTIRLHRTGWKTIHHNEVLARGLGARNYEEFHLQRWRWGAGAMQSLAVENPMFTRGLSMGQRLMYVASATSWFDSWRTLLFHLLPVVALTTGASPVDAPPEVLFPAIAVVHLMHLVTSKVFSRRQLRLLPNMVFEVLKMPANLSSSLVFFRPRKLSFAVTPKGRSGRGRIRHSVPMLLWLLLIADLVAWGYATFALAGLLPVEIDQPLLMVLGVSWVLANTFTVFLAIDRIRQAKFGGERRAGHRAAHALEARLDGRVARTVDVSLTGASLLVRSGPRALGDEVDVELDVGGAVARVRGWVRRADLTEVDGVLLLGVEFAPDQWRDLSLLATGLFRRGVTARMIAA